MTPHSTHLLLCIILFVILRILDGIFLKVKTEEEATALHAKFEIRNFRWDILVLSGLIFVREFLFIIWNRAKSFPLLFEQSKVISTECPLLIHPNSILFNWFLFVLLSVQNKHQLNSTLTISFFVCQTHRLLIIFLDNEIYLCPCPEYLENVQEVSLNLNNEVPKLAQLPCFPFR